jgi:hypothetical protein
MPRFPLRVLEHRNRFTIGHGLIWSGRRETEISLS